MIDFIESDINGINYIVSVGMPNPYRKVDAKVGWLFEFENDLLFTLCIYRVPSLQKMVIVAQQVREIR